MGEKTISILVIGKNSHESNLDLCLAARAFGASSVTFAGKRNPKMVRYLQNVVRNWGGSFSVNFTDDWRGEIASRKNYKVVYLTRFGVPINKLEYGLRTYKNLLVVVTLTENVKNLYRMADFNVSITTQPHCSAAAVAVFLHHFYEGRELAMHFENARYKVVPEERRIHVEKSGGNG